MNTVTRSGGLLSGSYVPFPALQKSYWLMFIFNHDCCKYFATRSLISTCFLSFMISWFSLSLSLIFLYSLIYACVHAHICTMVWWWRITSRSWFFSSTTWVLGIKLKSSGLVISTFTFESSCQPTCVKFGVTEVAMKRSSSVLRRSGSFSAGFPVLSFRPGVTSVTSVCCIFPCMSSQANVGVFIPSL